MALNPSAAIKITPLPLNLFMRSMKSQGSQKEGKRQISSSMFFEHRIGDKATPFVNFLLRKCGGLDKLVNCRSTGVAFCFPVGNIEIVLVILI